MVFSLMMVVGEISWAKIFFLKMGTKRFFLRKKGGEGLIQANFPKNRPAKRNIHFMIHDEIFSSTYQLSMHSSYVCLDFIDA